MNEHLHDCAAELVEPGGYLDRLTEHLPEDATPAEDVAQRGQSNRPKVIGSPAPWNAEIAGLLLEIHAAARRHDADLRWLAFSGTLTRGSSDQVTRRLLRGLPHLIDLTRGRFPGEQAPRRAERDLTSWPRRARALLDDDPREDEVKWTRAPGRLKCPHCGRRLRLAPGWQHEPSPPLWCRHCPANPDPEAGPHLSWPADAWVAVLNEGA